MESGCYPKGQEQKLGFRVLDLFWWGVFVCGLSWLLLCVDRAGKCEMVFTQFYENKSFCIFMVDDRRRSSLRNITSILNARYWTLAYGINRAYAHEYGYEIDYIQPDASTYRNRKAGQKGN